MSGDDRSRVQTRVRVVPLTLPKANECVSAWHRHHAEIPGGFAWFCVGAVAGGDLVGVAIAGRPTNRNNDDGQTVEVLRVATNGHPNACSALLGSCARAAKAIGARRVITYTLSDESGASLRGAGWTLECADTGKSWWATGDTRPRAVDRAHMATHKARWAKNFGDAVPYSKPKRPEGPARQVSLFPEQA